jgi:xanthine dehydrogenase accessory factor
MKSEQARVLVRGGGDLATGVAIRLHRSGFKVVVTERRQPLAVRRLVALAQAVYAGQVEIEGVCGQLTPDLKAALGLLEQGILPVLVDPQAASRKAFEPLSLVDGRMLKSAPELGKGAAPFVVGLGPGFMAGVDCHAVVETNRGHDMGRVIWEGGAEPDTRIPERVDGYDSDRVLLAPADGVFHSELPLGTLVNKGDEIAVVGDAKLRAPFSGVLRGLLHNGLGVTSGMKVGDVDPRSDPSYSFRISDKSLAVAGGVLEALLSQERIRAALGG